VLGKTVEVDSPYQHVNGQWIGIAGGEQSILASGSPGRRMKWGCWQARTKARKFGQPNRIALKIEVFKTSWQTHGKPLNDSQQALLDKLPGYDSKAEVDKVEMWGDGARAEIYVETGKTEVARIDNLLPTNLITHCCEERKKK
jgi:hypothetical protein